MVAESKRCSLIMGGSSSPYVIFHERHYVLRACERIGKREHTRKSAEAMLLQRDKHTREVVDDKLLNSISKDKTGIAHTSLLGQHGRTPIGTPHTMSANERCIGQELVALECLSCAGVQGTVW